MAQTPDKESLAVFFEDYSCTTLKEKYSSMTDEQLSAAMEEADMPDYMISIAKKVKNADWADYEKEFRIHSYEAYSDANYWNKKLKSTGGSFMGNPTGICASESGNLYVFVNSDVSQDASLYIAGCEGNNLIRDARNGVNLQKGLNIINVKKDELFYIIYTADTQSEKKKLSEWPAIKIHIEGGVVNGYYDVSRHSDADYKAILKNATHERFTVKGSYSAFNFKTESYRQIWPESIIRSINWFDSITVWEKEVMGICESVANGYRAEAPYNLTGGEGFFPSYYNNPNWAIQGDVGDPGYANSSAYRTSYNGFECVQLSFPIPRDDDGPWSVAHETGHNNQSTISLENCGEVSNNLFSNIMTLLDGRVMSWGFPLSTTMTDYINQVPFANRDIFSMTRMYYQLYLYYHQARRNTSFYPTLFQELRNDPLVLGKGDQSQLKFVRKVCKIVNEDLTDFFNAWGFFIESNDKKSGYEVTQEEIDATLAEISLYPRKNREILFIEDRIEVLPTLDLFCTPGRSRVDQEKRMGSCGDMGQFTDYLPCNIITSEYQYAQMDTLISVTNGKGAVGIIVLDQEQNMLFASNCLNFILPQNILGQDYTLFTVYPDGTLQEISKTDNSRIYAEVEVLTPGTLSSLISTDALSAKISGSINGTDIKYLRQLINKEKLSVIDLSDVRIVKGGGIYFVDEYNKSFETKNDVMGGGIFKECRNLSSIKLPESITKIEQDVFPRCQISQLVIPDKVVSIEWYSLADCQKLKEVTFGENVSVLGPGVFWATPVKNLYMKPLVPPSFDDISLSSNPTIHVHADALDAYKSSNWAQYGTIVGDLDDILSIPAFEQENPMIESLFDLFGNKIKEVNKGGIYIINGKKKVVH